MSFPVSARKTVETLICLLKQRPNIISWDHTGKMKFYNVESTRGANLYFFAELCSPPQAKVYRKFSGCKDIRSYFRVREHTHLIVWCKN